MNNDSTALDHLHRLRQEAGPVIIGEIIADTEMKVSILTPYGIYDISRSDVLRVDPDDTGNKRVTVSKGAKILFSRLIDAESLLPRNRASLASVAQGAKHLQFALNRVLGKVELPYQSPREASVDCPMSDCTDCCECPVIEGAAEASDRNNVRMEYYERKIGRNQTDDYRKPE